MPWARLDDRIIMNIKLRQLSDAAFRIWTLGLAYCAQELTDGFVPTAALSMFPVTSGTVDNAVDELCSAVVAGKPPLWNPVTHGYQVHDYLAWNESREKVIQQHELKLARQERWAAKQRGLAHVNGDASPVASGVATAMRLTTRLESRQETVPIPSPSPSPSPSEKRKTARDDARSPATDGFEAFWDLYPKKTGKLAAAKSWSKLHPSEKLQTDILAAVTKQLDSQQWADEGGKYIPNPTTWLNQGRWADEVFVRKPTHGKTGVTGDWSEFE